MPSQPTYPVDMTNEMTDDAPSPYTPAVEGCWFSDSRGIYIGEAVIAEAVSKGFDPIAAGYKEADTHCYPPDNADGQPDYDHHYYHELTDRAETYLATFAPEGYWIGFNDGDFGMYKVEAGPDDEPDDEE